MKAETQIPFGRLMFLYLGSQDFNRDLAFYRDVLLAERVWHFEHFEARVAAFRIGEGPLVLIADHRPAPSCMPVFAVSDLKRVVATLKKRGWKPDGRRFEIPNGPCYTFHDPSGNPFAIFEDVRPDAMEQAYADSENAHAFRD